MPPSLYAPTSDTVKAASTTHQLANLIPRFKRDDYEQLKADIAKNGVLVPVVVTEDGVVLDGRHRLQACKELGRECPQITVQSEADVYAVILGLNIYRRHLSPEQVVAFFKNLQLKAPELAKKIVDVDALKAEAKAARNGVLKRGDARGARVTPTGKTAERQAKALGVSPATVKRVERVAKQAPEALPKIAKGETSTQKVLAEVSKDMPKKKPVPPQPVLAVETAKAPALASGNGTTPTMGAPATVGQRAEPSTRYPRTVAFLVGMPSSEQATINAGRRLSELVDTFRKNEWPTDDELLGALLRLLASDVDDTRA